MTRRLAALFVALALSIPAVAEARRTEWLVDKTVPIDHHLQLDLVGFLWPIGSTQRLGGAAWFGMPLLDKGFIPFNDSLFLEVGTYVAYLQHDQGGESLDFVALVPAGGVRWNLHLTEDWTLFLTGKAGYRLRLGDGLSNGLVLSFTIGAFWQFSRHLWLRLETGNYGVVNVGVSIPF